MAHAVALGANAAAGGFGVMEVELTSSHGSEAVARVECAVRVRWVWEVPEVREVAKDGENLEDVKGELKELKELKDGMEEKEHLGDEKDLRLKDVKDVKDVKAGMEQEKLEDGKLDLAAIFADDIAVQSAQLEVAPAKDAATGPEVVPVPKEHLTEAPLREEDQILFMGRGDSPEKAIETPENKENMVGFLAARVDWLEMCHDVSTLVDFLQNFIGCLLHATELASFAT